MPTPLKVPLKVYHILLSALDSGWNYDQKRSDYEKGLVFLTRGEYGLSLDRGTVRIYQNGTAFSRFGLHHFKIHPTKPKLLLEVTKQMESFDLDRPWQGLIPPTDVFGELYFRPLKRLLNAFYKTTAPEAPKINALIEYIVKNRRNTRLPGRKDKIRSLLKQGDLVHWVIERESQFAVRVHPLKKVKVGENGGDD